MNKNTEAWIKCSDPEPDDIIRWEEPIWAATNKARGKPNKMGVQVITAHVVSVRDVIELYVISAEKKSGGGSVKVKTDDHILRKKASVVELGNCHKKNSRD